MTFYLFKLQNLSNEDIEVENNEEPLNQDEMQVENVLEAPKLEDGTAVDKEKNEDVKKITEVEVCILMNVHYMFVVIYYVFSVLVVDCWLCWLLAVGC